MRDKFIIEIKNLKIEHTHSKNQTKDFDKRKFGSKQKYEEKEQSYGEGKKNLLRGKI